MPRSRHDTRLQPYLDYYDTLDNNNDNHNINNNQNNNFNDDNNDDSDDYNDNNDVSIFYFNTNNISNVYLNINNDLTNIPAEPFLRPTIAATVSFTSSSLKILSFFFYIINIYFHKASFTNMCY